MGETNKQVRVDNWGIFFLQRLQMFFNKTDYCDLTLQFEGNVQLKVHRLVMSACTEYFNVLEHTCEVIDGNTIIMPDDLQTDVILPIVNFMYTGMLDFNMTIFDKLYRTAELMNIPILTKLLDAQRKPVPRTINRNIGRKSTPPPRKVHNNPVWKRKTFPATPVRTLSPIIQPESIRRPTIPADPLAIFDNTPKPTRFEWPDDELDSTFNLIDTSFNEISYTSKPLLTQDDELRVSTSFEDLKQSQSVNKKSNNYTNQPVDINDIKDYVKEQKTRAELADNDDDYDCDDPDNYLSIKRKPKEEISPETSAKRVRFNEKENRETTISVTQKNPGEMDHTKIISEVLKKYPHLVKKNKNIKLKIMTKPAGSKTDLRTIVKPTLTKLKIAPAPSSPKIKMIPKLQKIQQDDEGPWLCRKCPMANDEPVEFVLYYLYRKHMTEVHNEKFDPNMCKHCGHQSSKQIMLMYHQYTKHGVLPPPAYEFPKCDRCPFIAMTESMLKKHAMNHNKYELQCSECKVAFSTEHSLAAHMQITGHTGKVGTTNFDCQYCTKRYNTGSDLFSHIKSLHRDEARRDGMVSIDDTDYEEDDAQDDEEFLPAHIQQQPKPPPQQQQQPTQPQEKISVISNVKVSDSPQHTVESTSSDLMGNIGISGAGLVDIVVLDDNQQYILHNDQRLINNQGYVIPQIDNTNLTRNITEVITSQPNVMLQNTEIASTDELVMVLTDHDYNDGNGNGILTNDNSNIVVLYSHPVDGQQNQFITSEGKLMLNSQTGMLELRNENADSQDGQIESIELIQREINSGLLQQGGEVSTEGDSQLRQVVEGSSQEGTVEYHEEGEKVVEEEEENDVKDVLEEPGDDGQQGVDQEMMEVEEEQKQSQLPDLTETDEVQIIMNENVVEEPSVSEAMHEEYPQESEDIQEHAEQNGTETVDEHMETDNCEGPAHDEVTEEPQVDDGSAENCQISENSENICSGEFLEQVGSYQVDGERLAEGQEMQEETSGQQEGSEVLLENERLVQEDQEAIPENQELIPENQELIPENQELIPENQELIPGNQELIPENHELISENQELISQHEESMIENQELIQENDVSTIENQELIPENQLVQVNEEPIAKNPETILENQELLEESNPILTHEEHPVLIPEDQDPISENPEEESVQVNIVQEFTFLETPAVEESTSDGIHVDENSQTQDSQTSSSKEHGSDAEKPETSQSTKISILDDWEDTEDSQQSDNTAKKAEITVNKLIDDWDDEDDDGTKKSADL